MSNFEPQCKTKADLHREWARCLDMCEVHKLEKVFECIKLEGFQWKVIEYYPSFDSNPTDYEFAIAIIEGKPVFRGDKLWCGISNHQFTVKGLVNAGLAFEYVTVYDGRICASIDSCSWNPPKPKTFSLIDMPMPKHTGWRTKRTANHLAIYLDFNSSEDCCIASNKILEAIGLKK